MLSPLTELLSVQPASAIISFMENFFLEHHTLHKEEDK